MSLLAFPNELLLLVAKGLEPKDLNSLLRTNRSINHLLTPLLHDLAVRPKDGSPALCWASKHGHEPLARLLLDKGVDINAWDTKKMEREMVRLLPKSRLYMGYWDGKGCNALIWAVRKSDVNMCKLLLEKGANPNLQDISCLSAMTALHWTVNADVGLLLSSPTEGFYPDTVPQSAGEALVKLLLANGARINELDSCGLTTLHRAVRDNYFAVVKILVEEGADLDIQSSIPTHSYTGESGGQTALHWAVWSSDMTRLLVEGGANLEIQSYCGQTALHEAVAHENVDSVKLLLENGAQTEVENYAGYTPLMAAVERRAGEIIKLLLQHDMKKVASQN